MKQDNNKGYFKIEVIKSYPLKIRISKIRSKKNVVQFTPILVKHTEWFP